MGCWWILILYLWWCCWRVRCLILRICWWIRCLCILLLWLCLWFWWCFLLVWGFGCGFLCRGCCGGMIVSFCYWLSYDGLRLMNVIVFIFLVLVSDVGLRLLVMMGVIDCDVISCVKVFILGWLFGVCCWYFFFVDDLSDDLLIIR